MASGDEGCIGDDEFARRLAAVHDAILAGDQSPKSDLDNGELNEARDLLELIERVSQETPTAGHSDAATPIPDHPRAIGRFEVQRVLGQGGHGVVLLASDPLLKRQVALKVPRLDVLTTKTLRARFEREAEASAALSHPHIVPVLEFGHAGPVVYIASEYIKGCSLATWLERRQKPVDARPAAELVATLAEAVQHAHSRGVLHRDLKPGNVLLAVAEVDVCPQGLAAAARITDFGLAKIAGTPSQTQTGVIVGTPAYMSPEQADGQVRDISTAADVYSLGAVFYELLTGRPPLQKTTVLATLESIRREIPAPPSSFNADTPRDLEAVCLKCLEKSPSDRYAAASDLADELHRWLDGRTVLARPATRRERFARWWRRNPLLASLYSVSAVAVVAVVSVSLFAAFRISEARDSLAVSNQELRESLDAQTSIILDDLLSRQERLTEAHRAYLMQSLDAYRRLAERDAGDSESQLGAARAYGRVGQIQARLGQSAEALASLEHAIHRLTALESPADTTPLQTRIRLEGAAARVLKNLGRLPEAEQKALNRLQSARQLLAKTPDNADSRQELAAALGGLANILRQAGSYEESGNATREAISIQQDLAEQFPEAPNYASDLAKSWYHLGIDELRQRHSGKAEESVERARAIVRPLVSAHPDEDSYRRLLADSTMMHATICVMSGRFPQAESFYEEAIRTLRKLASDFPLNISHRVSLMDAHSNFGASLLQQHRLEGARRHLRNASEIAAQLVRNTPEQSTHRLRRANILFELSRAERGSAPPEALALAEEGMAELELIRDREMKDGYLPQVILAGYVAVGEAHVALNEHEKAAESARQLSEDRVVPSECDFAAARLWCKCVDLVEDDSTLDAAERMTLEHDYRNAAAGALAKWLNAGGGGLRRIEADPDLRRLMDSRPDLVELAKAVGEP